MIPKWSLQTKWQTSCFFFFRHIFLSFCSFPHGGKKPANFMWRNWLWGLNCEKNDLVFWRGAQTLISRKKALTCQTLWLRNKPLQLLARPIIKSILFFSPHNLLKSYAVTENRRPEAKPCAFQTKSTIKQIVKAWIWLASGVTFKSFSSWWNLLNVCFWTINVRWLIICTSVQGRNVFSCIDFDKKKKKK